MQDRAWAMSLTPGGLSTRNISSAHVPSTCGSNSGGVPVCASLSFVTISWSRWSSRSHSQNDSLGLIFKIIISARLFSRAMRLTPRKRFKRYATSSGKHARCGSRKIVQLLFEGSKRTYHICFAVLRGHGQRFSLLGAGAPH